MRANRVGLFGNHGDAPTTYSVWFNQGIKCDIARESWKRPGRRAAFAGTGHSCRKTDREVAVSGRGASDCRGQIGAVAPRVQGYRQETDRESRIHHLNLTIKDQETGMTRQKILIVEDDPHILKLVQYNLEKAGFECRAAAAAQQAFEDLERQKICLIVLDVMLPGMDGFELCKEIKKKQTWAAIPILMLTAKSTTEDKVAGLDSGADDYITKPFSFVEFRSRVHALIRRSHQETSPTLHIEDLEVDPLKHRVKRGEKTINLTPKEFAVFQQGAAGAHQALAPGQPRQARLPQQTSQVGPETAQLGGPRRVVWQKGGAEAERT